MRSMGKLTLTLIVVGTAACGSDNNNTVDAHVVVPIDAKPIDAPKVFLDAPPAVVNLACFGVADPTTAADPVTIAGLTETLAGTALSPLAGAQVQAFKAGNATALDTQTSDANGAFTTGNLVTGGVPLDGYIVATKDTYRTTYLYPPNEVVANLAAVPVPMISQATVDMYNQLLNQTDATNGMLFITVADCSLAPIASATLTVKQGGNSVGTQLDLSLIDPSLAGIYLVANVPDGDTTIGATYNSMTFPSHVVTAHKKANTVGASGTVTASAVVPGPF
jgi:hypothetical protein